MVCRVKSNVMRNELTTIDYQSFDFDFFFILSIFNRLRIFHIISVLQYLKLELY